MKRIAQPDGSNLCGAAVVAMIAAITLDEACQWLGKRGLVNGGQLRRGLARLGFKTEKVDGIDGMGFGRVRWPDGGSHWFAFYRGVIYDPAYPRGWFDWPKGFRITTLERVAE